MNITTIAGNVGRDAELRTTQGGDKVLGFSVAVDNGKDASGNKRDATWFDCSIWGKRAEALAAHIRKGDKLALSGRVATRAHEGKAYLQLSVDQLTFQGSTAAHSNPESSGSRGSGGAPAGGVDDSEIPFSAIWWA